MYGFDGIVGNYASPYTPGSAYVLLHHVFGEVNGRKGVWGHAIGGMGAITQAMARSASARGVDIRVGAPVREVLVERGRAVGAVTEAGEAFGAAAVDLESQSQAAVPETARRRRAARRTSAQRIEHWRCGSGTFRMNVALSRAAGFSLPAGQAAGRSSHRGHHHGADAGLHGARILRCATAWLVARNRSSRC